MILSSTLTKTSLLTALLMGVHVGQGDAKSDASLLVAHHRVLQSISAPPRKLLHQGSESNGKACSICYGGVKPHHPNRELALLGDEDEAGIGSSGDNSTLVQSPLSCSSYGTTFLSQLFPDDPSCRAFQGSAADICGCPRPPSICTICDYGVPSANPDNTLPIGTVGNSAPLSCSDWDATSAALHFEGSPECDATRKAALEYCGCPQPCHLCGEGYRLANPMEHVDDVQGLVSAIIGLPDDEDDYPTCRDAENAAAIASAAFSTLEASSPYAEDVFDKDGGDLSIFAGVSSTCELYKSVYGSTCSCIELPEMVTAAPFVKMAVFDKDGGGLSIFAGVSNTCELYKSVYGSTCSCIELPEMRDGCNLCENGLADPSKKITVDLDGISATTTCGNTDSLAFLGVGTDICSQISALDCPCLDDGVVASGRASVISATSEASSASSRLDDPIGTSLMVCAVIVVFAALV
eukprot:CAMPEP_0178553572 /NCGR_PEP_ID=MMETSP0697-20121206/7883_1 /TAXON_ID=265572 /ORGANISM="Extubocellulus spinifer, Strain CCMP396" /LENGTH=464 /DNA_ID=CAMNT_0020186487 /DNA_START=640 /DNA_END=2035 /DNA_ORIENTATION=+